MSGVITQADSFKQESFIFINKKNKTSKSQKQEVEEMRNLERLHEGNTAQTSRFCNKLKVFWFST